MLRQGLKTYAANAPINQLLCPGEAISSVSRLANMHLLAKKFFNDRPLVWVIGVLSNVSIIMRNASPGLAGSKRRGKGQHSVDRRLLTLSG